MERQANVDLVQAEEAAIRPHHPEIVREREHAARRERMPVDGCDGGHIERDETREERDHRVDEPRRLALPRPTEPVEVQAGRVELLLPDGDQSRRTGRGLHGVDRPVESVEERAIEAILAGLQRQHEDTPLAAEINHRGPSRCGSRRPPYLPDPEGRRKSVREAHAAEPSEPVRVGVDMDACTRPSTTPRLRTDSRRPSW